MSKETKAAKRKVKPNKQKEVTAETFRRMASEIRTRRAARRRQFGGLHPQVMQMYNDFAQTLDGEAVVLRSMR
jgi:hypothetical protein